MKCEYCSQEIPAGTEIVSEGRYFCNTMHRYLWQKEKGQSNDFAASKKTDGIFQDALDKSAFKTNDAGKIFDKTRPMMLGDIFSTAFNLIKETFLRNLILALIILVPLGLIFAFGFHSFFTAIANYMNAVKDDPDAASNPSQLLGMFFGMGKFFFIAFLLSVGSLAVNIGITEIGCCAMDGESAGLKQAFKKIFSITYLRCVGQILLISVIVLGIILGGVIIFAVAKAGDFTILKFIGGLYIFAAVLFIIYLVYRWYFAFIIIIHKDYGVLKSFSKSSFLVEGYWWRTFGIVFLISLIIQFAVSLIITPVSFIFMWDYISQYMNLAAAGAISDKDPSAVINMMKSFGFDIGIVAVISTLLKYMLEPLFIIVLYYDLRIRKNDLENPAPLGTDQQSLETSLE